MATPNIDISENTLRNRGRVLDILLIDRTRYKPSRPYNIIWATDSYATKGKGYKPKDQIKREQATGVNGTLIQPRASKSKEEQKYRTKEKAEVFTPLKIVKEMNLSIDRASKNYPTNDDNWIDYIKERRLEITCGEGPFIVGRYDPTTNTGIVISPKNRVGFFDRKLQVVCDFAKTEDEWLKYAELALKACYGYEWQGDNLLIARENVLQTMDDFYKYFRTEQLKLKSKKGLTDKQLEDFAEIISWNIWQMDGLKYVIPMSCKKKRQPIDSINENQLPLIPSEKPKKQLIECEGCRTNSPHKHTGHKAQIMDWETGKRLYFYKLTTASNE